MVFEEAETGKKIVYYTDCKRLTDEAYAMAEGADLVILDALRPDLHPTHMNVEEALASAEKIGAPQTYFTHMTFMIDHEEDGAKLPKGIDFAYDGLVVEI
jgi:phosphoribosyl 1,2-cyclic phosphate phosphodiesterase